MIRDYNRLQRIYAVLAAVGGIGACTITYGFFRFGSGFVARQFGGGLTGEVENGIGIVGLVLVLLSGFRTSGGFLSYAQSGLYHHLGVDSGAGYAAERAAHRVTAPAYLLSQIFLAGPILLLQARRYWTNVLEQTADREARMESVLERLRRAGKWQSLSEYPDSELEIRSLAQMGLIDFSTQKGAPRFKIR